MLFPRGPRCLPAWSPSCLQEADGMRCRFVEWMGAVGVYSEDTRGEDTSGPRAPTGPFPPPRCPPCVLPPRSSLGSLFKQSLGSFPFGHPVLMGRVSASCSAEAWGPGPSPAPHSSRALPATAETGSGPHPETTAFPFRAGGRAPGILDTRRLFVVCLHLLFWQTLPKIDDSPAELSVE